MALESTVIAKIVGGITAVGVSGGAGYYAYTNNLFSWNTYVYLIAKTSTEGTDSIGELLDDNKNNLYQCKFKNIVSTNKDIYDSDCEIYLIEGYTSGSDKTIAIDKVTSAVKSEKEKSAANIKTENKYLKIKIRSSQLKNIDFFNEKKVEIVKSDADIGKTNEKVFGKLTALYWTKENFESDKKEVIDFPIKYVLVKGNHAGTGTDSVKANSKCFLSDVDVPFSCEIWKYTTDPTKTGEKISNPNLGQLTKDTGTNNNLSAIDTSKYYVIEFKEDVKLNKDIVSKKIISMVEWDGSKKEKSSGKKEHKFTFENFLIGELSVASHLIDK